MPGISASPKNMRRLDSALVTITDANYGVTPPRIQGRTRLNEPVDINPLVIPHGLVRPRVGDKWWIDRQTGSWTLSRRHMSEAEHAAGAIPLYSNICGIVVLPTEGVVSLDFAHASAWDISPSGPVTIAPTNLPPAGSIAHGVLTVYGDIHPLTWPSGTRFPGGAAPTLSGETYIEIVARSTGLVVGVKWSDIS